MVQYTLPTFDHGNTFLERSKTIKSTILNVRLLFSIAQVTACLSRVTCVKCGDDVRGFTFPESAMESPTRRLQHLCIHNGGFVPESGTVLVSPRKSPDCLILRPVWLPQRESTKCMPALPIPRATYPRPGPWLDTTGCLCCSSIVVPWLYFVEDSASLGRDR